MTTIFDYYNSKYQAPDIAPPNNKKKDRHKNRSRWHNAAFIAWDGEGRDVEILNEYGDRKHIYNFFASSEDVELYSGENEGLSTVELLDTLCDSAILNPDAINVIYGGSYDMNMILRDIPKEIMQEIADADGRDFVTWGMYGIRLIQRKYLTVGRYADDRIFIQKTNGEWKRNFECTITLWDVIGFFQSAFVPAVESWLGKDWPDLKLIKEGKEKRKDFSATELSFIRKYNAAELRALVRLMEKLHEALDNLGLKLSRWDGAGAVAAAINQKQDVKKWIGEPRKDKDDPIQIACQHAYFGGRIEIGKFGTYEGDVFHYDINSAYPAGQIDVPQMTCGRWYKLKGAEAEAISKHPTLTVYLIKWDLEDGLLFGPFPYRSELQSKVLFPSAGLNWVWKPEVEAAYDVFDGEGLNILECWTFVPDGDIKPFAWIIEYYARRQELVRQTKNDGILRGEEKVIKLGLNSLYGKTAQRAGYNKETGRIPPYHNLAYAGYITSKTRSLLWKAAMQKPDNIIAMATDGIFSTAPLDLYCPKEKELGKWEYQKHDGMILAQSGFYWIKDGDEWRGWSRGFDKIPSGPDYQSQMSEQINKIKTAWKKKEDAVYFPCTRFITLKTALSGGEWWGKWCCWYSMRAKDGTLGRKLKLWPDGTKRIALKGRPDKEMVQTIPERNYTPETISMLYNIPWMIQDDRDSESINLENEISND